MGLASDFEWALAEGGYHNGPLSLIVPLGIWGAIAFLWLTIAGIRLLYHNYRWGESPLRQINTFLLALFVARFIFFCFVYGEFVSDLPLFLGTLGLSISLNGGMRMPEPATNGQP